MNTPNNGLTSAPTPMMDVARDARWGRVTETYGEDSYLVSAMSVAFTRGMQGDDLREGVIACAKHFVGYAQTEAGQNMAAVAVGPRELHDVYARPFEAAIRLAGLAGVMASYSEFGGVPIHTSRAVLTDLLRGRLGFTGTVVSDYNGIGWAQTRQLVASSPEEVGALGVSSGPWRAACCPRPSSTSPCDESCATSSLYWLLGISVLKTGAFVKYGRVKKLWSYVALERIPHVASTGITSPFSSTTLSFLIPRVLSTKDKVT